MGAVAVAQDAGWSQIAAAIKLHDPGLAPVQPANIHDMTEPPDEIEVVRMHSSVVLRNSLSGEVIAKLAVAPDARWPQLAAAIKLHDPGLQPLPPANARLMTAPPAEIEVVRMGIRALR